MSFGDMATFMPSKSAYVNPGEYEATQRNVALQKGGYMAQMDAFYKQLDETSRQFDLSHSLDTRKFKDTQGIERGRFGLERSKFRLEHSRFGLEQSKFGLEQSKFGLEQGRFGLDKDKFDFGAAISSASFLQSLREFEVNTALRERELEIDAAGGRTDARRADEEARAGRMGTLFDFVGAGMNMWDSANSNKTGSTSST